MPKLFEKRNGFTCAKCKQPCTAQLIPGYYADHDPDWISLCCRDIATPDTHPTTEAAPLGRPAS